MEAGVDERIPCAGAVVLDGQRRLLVIQRGTEPSAGRWSIPGGRCLPGESREDACVREAAEETGVAVRVLRHAGDVVRDGPGGVVYDISDYACTPTGGELAAGDDAADARWVTAAELGELPLVPGLLECLAAWDLLPD
jgi:8-oxo-dGTP diphosphatase